MTTMMRRLPKYVQHFIDHNDYARFYFRRDGFKRVPLPGLPWSPKFMEAYEAAMDGQPPQVAVLRKPKQGSFAELAASYFASTAYRTMQPSTQGVYNNAIARWCKQIDKNGNEVGTLSAASLRRDHVVAMMAAKAEKPDSANLMRKVLRAMMQHAIEIGLRPDDPTRDVKAIPTKSDGFHSWTDDEISQFEANHPVGTRPRLALALLLYTGQRRSDVVTMVGSTSTNAARSMSSRSRPARCWRSQYIRPCGRSSTPRRPEHLTYLTTAFGKPFTAAGFGNWFREQCNEAGLPHCSAHGLRKAAARRLAEAGCTTHEIAAITGHASLREVVRYTKAVDQVKLAEAAMDKMRTADCQLSKKFTKGGKK